MSSLRITGGCFRRRRGSRSRRLEEICEEEAAAAGPPERGLHRVLHGWLLVHLPFSAGLILLAIIHAIGALRY